MPIRRFFQFRMRTLLIVATLLCVALAFIVVPARRHRQAVLELRQHGIVVDYEHTIEHFNPTWSQVWLGCDFRQPVLSVIVARPLTERDWQLILICQPPHFSIETKHGGDRDLARLTGLRSLEALTFKSPLVTDQNIKDITKISQLHSLEIRTKRFMGGALVRLSALHQLRHLSLYGTIQKEDLTELKTALPQCHVGFIGAKE